MGRKLVNVASELGFFSRSLTSACFQVSRKLPVCIERLIILLTTGRRTSRHSTTRGVGIGSRLQDVLLDFPIRHLISSSVRGENELSGVEHRDGVSAAGVERAAFESSSPRMRSIFCAKNLLVSLAKVLVSWYLWKIKLTSRTLALLWIIPCWFLNILCLKKSGADRRLKFFLSHRWKDNHLVLPTGLIMWIGLRKEIRKLTFRGLVLRRSEEKNLIANFSYSSANSSTFPVVHALQFFY